MLENGKYYIVNYNAENPTPVIGTVPPLVLPRRAPVIGLPKKVMENHEQIWDVRHVGPDPEGDRYSLEVNSLWPRAVEEGDKTLVFGFPREEMCESWIINPVDEAKSVYSIGPVGDPRPAKWTLGGLGHDQVSIQVLLLGVPPWISPLQQFQFREVTPI